MIKAVIFDMYETLITQYGGPVYFRAQMAADAGIDPMLFDALWIPSENDRTIGKQTLEETIEQILRQTGKYSKEIFQTIITGRKAAKADCFRHLHPEIIPMLQTLKEKQIKIGLISNCYSEEAVLIRESQLFSYFDQACLSYELGMKKPDPGIFLKCMEGLGVKAGECLYIGDGGSHELEAADIMGMTALQARWYIKEVPELDIRKEKFEQLETPMAVLDKI